MSGIHPPWYTQLVTCRTAQNIGPRGGHSNSSCKGSSRAQGMARANGDQDVRWTQQLVMQGQLQGAGPGPRLTEHERSRSSA